MGRDGPPRIPHFHRRGRPGRRAGLKVLVCPEDVTQVAVGREMLVEKLPDDVRRRVVWRETFWLTDEALSVYVRSAGLFGLEMHSPIMCVGNGVPAIVGRFEEQTSKAKARAFVEQRQRETMAVLAGPLAR